MKTVRITSDIDQEDRILAGLTARQLVLVAVPAFVLWVAFMALRSFVPLIAFAPVAVIVAGVVGTLVVTKRDGLAMDRFGLAGIRYRRTPRRRSTAAATVDHVDGVAALGLPVRGVGDDGIIDLGGDGVAIACDAFATNLLLQSEAEQEALTTAFGQFCNSLDLRMQVLIRAEPVDLSDAVASLTNNARHLPTIGLEQAAADHARFLDQLASRHDVVRRRVIVVLRDEHASIETNNLARRAVDAANALRPAGIELRRLGGFETAALVQHSSAPGGPAMPLVDDNSIISGVWK